ncbi:MAG: hypothetical protein HKN23_08025 [Verrucomicrobiales bacterium]|nr:hypothetical protein [Verrucomicrobiales bacterium]
MIAGLPRLQIFLVCFISIGIGWAIWHFSPAIAGAAEPWDASNPYFPTALFLAGLVSAIPGPRFFWIAPIGLYVGQVAFLFLTGSTGPLIVIGLVMLMFFTLVGLAGSAVTFATWKLAIHRKSDS